MKHARQELAMKRFVNCSLSGGKVSVVDRRITLVRLGVELDRLGVGSLAPLVAHQLDAQAVH